MGKAKEWMYIQHLLSAIHLLLTGMNYFHFAPWFYKIENILIIFVEEEIEA